MAETRASNGSPRARGALQRISGVVTHRVHDSVARSVDRRFVTARARARCSTSPSPLPVAGTVVVLVPGFAHDWARWRPLEAALARAGVGPRLRFCYDPWEEGFDELAGRLHRLLRTLEAQGVGRIHLVAHSMGGILVREALRRGAGRIGVVVTLGSPHRGSPWAGLPGLPESVHRLRIGSATLRRLAGGAPARPEWVSVSGGRDAIVPAFLSRWTGARQIRLPGADHSGVLASVAAVAVVLRCLGGVRVQQAA